MRIRIKNLYMNVGLLMLTGVLMVSCPEPGEPSGSGSDSSAGNCPPDCVALDDAQPDLGLANSACGTACDPALNQLCLGGLTCISGTCLNPDVCMGCGQTCNSDADCPAEFECTSDNICYDQTLCREYDPSVCGSSCTGDLDCAPGLECYPTEPGYCWEWDPNASCTGPGCGDACNTHGDCGGLTCIIWGYCGGTHSSVCDGCGAACETNADCPGSLECVNNPYHGNICWSDTTCESLNLQIPPDIVEELATPEIIAPPGDEVIDPVTGFTIDPISGLPIDPILDLPIDPLSGLPFEPTECVDDGVCTGGEQTNGSCRDCSVDPGDGCGVPCPAGLCGGGLTCTGEVCWDAAICGGSSDDGGGGSDDDKPECSCQCVTIGTAERCTDTCTGSSCRP